MDECRMASDGSINAPPLEGADDWTMVNRVSELIENGNMSDISLPPLPALGASDNGSLDESAGEDAQSSKRSPQDSDAEWPRAPASLNSSDESDETSCTGCSAEAVEGGRGSSLSLSGRRRLLGNSRRRAASRARGSRGGCSDTDSSSSSPSSSPSPAARPRRLGSRAGRSARRLDQRPSSLVFSSGRGSRASFSTGVDSSPSPPPSCRESIPGGMMSDDAIGLSTGDDGGGVRAPSWTQGDVLNRSFLEESEESASRSNLEDGGVASEGRGHQRNGSTGLFLFSLEDVTTIGPSETVSVSSSPFRNLGRGDTPTYRWPPGMDSRIVPTRNVSGISVSTEGAREEDSMVLVGDRGGALTGDAAAGGEIAEGITATDPPSSKNIARAERPNDDRRDVVTDTGVLCAGTDYMSLASSAPGSTPDRPSRPRAVSASRVRQHAVVTPRSERGTAQNASEVSNSVAVVSSAARTRDARADSAAWEVSSLAGGATVPLNRFLSGNGPVGVPGEWGIGSAGLGRGTASVLEFSTYKLAVSEARADAAEEQGEFWATRARSAELENRRLRKVLAEQSARIKELERRLGEAAEAEAASNDVYSRCLRGEDLVREGSIDGPMASSASPRRSPASEEEAGDVATSVSLSGPNEAADPGGQDGPDDAAEAAGEEVATAAESVGGAEAGALEPEEPTTDEDEDDDVESAATRALARIGGIAFTRFSLGQVAMFFPTPEGNFLAFNVGCPGHFLSKESQALIGRDEHFRPYYILGRIIEIQDVICCDANPFGLPSGHQIKVVYVETISSDLQAAGLQARSLEV